MPLQTSDDLRARYRELLDISRRKTDVTNTEEKEMMGICKILTERGYVPNVDASDWVLELSSNGWQLQDEN